jgi:DNA-binding transcriptional MerR regulator
MTGPATDAPFRTIGELSSELGVPQHVLRYWESRFPQLRPLTRAGNRRYYRPEDVVLVRRIHRALSEQGYTIKGVQRLIEAELGMTPASAKRALSASVPAVPRAAATFDPGISEAIDLRAELAAVRDALRALIADAS